MRNCITCNGTGMQPHDDVACCSCGGTGEEINYKPLDKYNSELTTIKNKSYMSGFTCGFICALCFVYLVLKVI
jgi:DnaJ-class molecular chaperone